MEFEMAGETEDWLIFEKDGSGVELCKLLTSSNQMTKNLTSELKKTTRYIYQNLLSPDQKSLVEYEIEKAVLNITSVHDKSRAYVRIVFRRKFENHITNTFLQACSNT